MKKQVKKNISRVKILLRDKLTKQMAIQAKSVIQKLQEKTGKQKVIKKLLVKEWLLQGKTITARQCSRLFGADRLSDIIFNLRKEGMIIESPLNPGKDRFSNDVEFSIYRWMGESPRITKRKKRGQTPTYNFLHHYPMGNAVIKKRITQYLALREKTKVIKIGFLKGGNRVLCSTPRGSKLFVINYKQK